ncbi:MAG: glycosyltransferase [Candidatus Lokiarchaeota archaeon]|nr:glycosyltransferase [Candidatus Lokiarchaeota archaeon]
MKSKRKNKVLIIHNHITPYRLPLFEELNKFCDLEVLFCKVSQKDRRWKKKQLDFYNFNHSILNSFNLKTFIINYSLPIKLFNKKIDVIIVGDNPINIFATFCSLIISKIRKIKFVIWTEGIDTILFHTKRSNKYIRRFLRFYRYILYNNTSYFIAYSKKALQYLKRFNLGNKEYFSGIQIMPHSLLGNKSKEKKKENTINILFLGYLRKSKGADILIKAYLDLDIKNNKTQLLIGGDGPEKENLMNLAKSRSDIVFLGTIRKSEKSEFYSKGDIFVLPTLHDAWGLVINEAIYYELPIITTNAAGASELIEMGKNGYVIPPNNIEALKNKLKILIKNDSLRQKFSENSIKMKKILNIETGIKPFIQAIFSE